MKVLKSSEVFCSTAAADRYIDGYYNIRRLHFGLDYLNPLAFEALYYQKAGWDLNCNYLTNREKCKPKVNHVTVSEV